MRPWPASDDKHVYAFPPISPSAATAPINSLHPSVTSAASALACPAHAGGRDVLRRHGAVHRKARAGHLSPNRVIGTIQTCRLATLGGRTEQRLLPAASPTIPEPPAVL